MMKLFLRLIFPLMKPHLLPIKAATKIYVLSDRCYRKKTPRSWLMPAAFLTGIAVIVFVALAAPLPSHVTPDINVNAATLLVGPFIFPEQTLL